VLVIVAAVVLVAVIVADVVLVAVTVVDVALVAVTVADVALVAVTVVASVMKVTVPIGVVVAAAMRSTQRYGQDWGCILQWLCSMAIVGANLSRLQRDILNGI
jgi:hypothetical protein